MADLPRTNLEMRSGNEKSWLVTVTDAAGDPVSLVGVASISWIVSNGVDAPAIFTKTIGDGVAIVSAAAGTLRLTLAEANTAALAGWFYHEARAVDSAGVTQTILRGTLQIEMTVH